MGTCQSSILDSLYSRNQIAPTVETFLATDAVPMDKTVSLRNAAEADIMGGGQGFLHW